MPYLTSQPLPDSHAAFVSGARADTNQVSADPSKHGSSHTAAADGALSGLRLAVKDLFHMQGVPTAAGNPTWLATHPLPDTTNSSVAALLDSGASYVGKTLTDELAYSLNGQNIHYPILHNPLTPERLTGGSSSGSAAAVASDLADIGLGTDTGGSIRVPASYNALYGLRTTHGAISCDNMVALAPSFDTVGWMCKSIETLYKVAHVLLPQSQRDEIKSIDLPIKKAKTEAIFNPRIFVANNLIDKSEQATHINSWLKSLTNASINKASFDAQALKTSETFRTLQGYEIWQQHGKWITQHSPTFADDVHERFMWCKALSADEQQRAFAQQHIINHQLDTIFENHDLMALPTTPGRAPLLEQAAGALATYRNDLMYLTAIAGLSGRPQIHLPLFSIDGAPCGLSLIGNKNSDLFLIILASELIKQSTSFTLAEHI